MAAQVVRSYGHLKWLVHGHACSIPKSCTSIYNTAFPTKQSCAYDTHTCVCITLSLPLSPSPSHSLSLSLCHPHTHTHTHTHTYTHIHTHTQDNQTADPVQLKLVPPLGVVRFGVQPRVLPPITGLTVRIDSSLQVCVCVCLCVVCA